MTEEELKFLAQRWDKRHERAVLSMNEEYRAITQLAYDDIRALLGHIYTHQWGAPERIGPRQWRWPPQEPSE